MPETTLDRMVRKSVKDDLERDARYQRCMVHFERNVLARVNPRNREIRRRTRVVGSFPDGRSALMLVRTRALYHVERVVDAPLPRHVKTR